MADDDVKGKGIDRKGHTRQASSVEWDLRMRALEAGTGLVNRLSRSGRLSSLGVYEMQPMQPIQGSYGRLSSEIDLPGTFPEEQEEQIPEPEKNDQFSNTPGSVKYEIGLSMYNNQAPLQELPPAFQKYEYPVRNVDQSTIDIPDAFVQRNKAKAIYEGLKVTVGLGPSDQIFSESAKAAEIDPQEKEFRANALEASHRFRVNTEQDPEYDYKALVRAALTYSQIAQKEVRGGKMLTSDEIAKQFPSFREEMLKGLRFADNESEYFVRRAGAYYSISSGVGTLATQVAMPLLGLPYADESELGRTENFSDAQKRYIGLAGATAAGQIAAAGYVDPWLTTNAQIKEAIYTEFRALGARASRKLLETAPLQPISEELRVAMAALRTADNNFQAALTQGETGEFQPDSSVDNARQTLVDALDKARNVLGMKQSFDDGQYLNTYMKSARSVLQGLSLLTGAITSNPYIKYGIDATIGTGSTAILPWLATSDDGRKWGNVLNAQLRSVVIQMLTDEGKQIINNPNMSDDEKIEKLSSNPQYWNKDKLDVVIDGFSAPRMDRMQAMNSYEKRITQFEIGQLYDIEPHEWELYQKFQQMNVGLSRDYIDDDDKDQKLINQYRERVTPSVLAAGGSLPAEKWEEWMALEKNNPLSADEKSVREVLAKKDKTSTMSELEFDEYDELREMDKSDLSEEQEIILERYKRRAEKSLRLQEKRLLEILNMRAICTPSLTKRDSIVTENTPSLKKSNPDIEDNELSTLWRRHFEFIQALHFEKDFPPIDQDEVQRLQANIERLEGVLKGAFNDNKEAWKNYLDETYKAATGLKLSEREILEAVHEKVARAKEEMTEESKQDIRMLQDKLRQINEDALLLPNNWSMTSPLTQERLVRILPGNNEYIDMAMADYVGILIRKIDQLFTLEFMQRLGGASVILLAGGKGGSSVIGSSLNVLSSIGQEARLATKVVCAAAIALLGQIGAYNTANAAMLKGSDRSALQKHAISGAPSTPFWLTKFGMFLNQAFIAPLALFKGEEKELRNTMNEALKALQAVDAIARTPIEQQADAIKRLTTDLSEQILTIGDQEEQGLASPLDWVLEEEDTQSILRPLKDSAANPDWENEAPVEVSEQDRKRLSNRLSQMSESTALENLRSNIRRRSTATRQSIQTAREALGLPPRTSLEGGRPGTAMSGSSSTSSQPYGGFLRDVYGIKAEDLIEEEGLALTPQMALEDVKAWIQKAQQGVQRVTERKVIGKIDNVNISEEDVDSLNPGQYLTDNAVDYLVRQRSKHVESDKIHFMNAGLAEFLKLADNESIQSNSAMFDMNRPITFIPVHDPDFAKGHWELLVVDRRAPANVQFHRYDSYNRPEKDSRGMRSDKEARKIIMQLKNIPGFENINEKNLYSHRVVQQEGADCGIHVAGNATILASKIESDPNYSFGELITAVNAKQVRPGIQTDIYSRLELLEQQGDPKQDMNKQVDNYQAAIQTLRQQIERPIVKRNTRPEDFDGLASTMEQCIWEMNRFRNNSAAKAADFDVLVSKYQDISDSTTALITAVEAHIGGLPAVQEYVEKTGVAKGIAKMAPKGSSKSKSSDEYLKEKINAFRNDSLEAILEGYKIIEVVNAGKKPSGILVADKDGVLIYEYPNHKDKAYIIPAYLRSAAQEAKYPPKLGDRAHKDFVSIDETAPQAGQSTSREAGKRKLTLGGTKKSH